MQAQQFLFYRETALTQAWAQVQGEGSIYFLPFPCLYAYAWFCAETSENEISFRHNTSTRIFTIRGYVWPVKTLDPDYLAPYSSRVVMFGWFCLCQCLHRISFSLGSSLLLAVVSTSLVKTMLQHLLVKLSKILPVRDFFPLMSFGSGG